MLTDEDFVETCSTQPPARLRPDPIRVSVPRVIASELAADPEPPPLMAPSDEAEVGGLAEALVEVEPDPDLDPPEGAIARLERLIAEQTTAISAFRSELAESQGGQLSTLLDSHERTEAAREEARTRAEHAAKERAEWGAWMRTQITRCFAGLTGVALYAWGRPDTHELIGQILKIIVGGEP